MYRLLSMILITSTAFSISNTSHAGNLYKWVDENGVTQYGDSIPGQEAKFGRAQLNEQGVVQKKTDETDIIDPEQEKKKALLEAKKAEEKKRKEKIALLKEMYPTKERLNEAKIAEIASIKLSIDIIKKNIVELNTRVDSYIKQAIEIEKSSPKVPTNLYDQIAQTKHDLKSEKARLEKRKAEITTIEEEYAKKEKIIFGETSAKDTTTKDGSNNKG